MWPPLLDIQEVWETEELEPPPEELITKWEEPPLAGRAGPGPAWGLPLPDGEEPDAPCRPEPEPEGKLIWEAPAPGLNDGGPEEPPWMTMELLEPPLGPPLEPPLEPLLGPPLEPPLGPLLEPLLGPPLGRLLGPLEPPLEPLLETLELEMELLELLEPLWLLKLLESPFPMRQGS